MHPQRNKKITINILNEKKKKYTPRNSTIHRLFFFSLSLSRVPTKPSSTFAIRRVRFNSLNVRLTPKISACAIFSNDVDLATCQRRCGRWRRKQGKGRRKLGGEWRSYPPVFPIMILCDQSKFEEDARAWLFSRWANIIVLAELTVNAICHVRCSCCRAHLASSRGDQARISTRAREK